MQVRQTSYYIVRITKNSGIKNAKKELFVKGNNPVTLAYLIFYENDVETFFEIFPANTYVSSREFIPYFFSDSLLLGFYNEQEKSLDIVHYYKGNKGNPECIETNYHLSDICTYNDLYYLIIFVNEKEDLFFKIAFLDKVKESSLKELIEKQKNSLYDFYEGT